MKHLSRLWHNSAPFTLLGLAMLVTLSANLIGLATGHRVITGAPAWLKPAKFSISTAIFAFTMPWISGNIRVWPRVISIARRAIALAFAIEIAIIDAQAARGVASHFNEATPLDAALYATMAATIAILWISLAIVTLALFRQSFADAGFGWSLRLGTAVTLVGASLGAVMTPPTAAQLEQARSTGAAPTVGAHTVGAPDGGRGLPVTAWSANHGDLRIAHFFGLHGLQLIPLLAWRIRRRPWLAILCGASYAALVLILEWQALRGLSIAHPDRATLIAWASWAAVTSLAAAWIVRFPPLPSRVLRSAA